MSAPTYFKNPLLKSGFQKNGSIGEIPGTEVSVTEINQLKGVTSNIQQQLDSIINAQSWGDVAVKNLSEFVAAVELSATKPVRIHLTEDISINQALRLNLTNVIIDGQDFYGFRFPVGGSLTLTGGSAIFQRTTFYHNSPEYSIYVIGYIGGGLQHFIFSRCGFWDYTLDLPVERRTNKFLKVSRELALGNQETEILLDSPLFYNPIGYGYYGAIGLLFTHDSEAPLNKVSVIAYDNRGDGSSHTSNKIAFQTAAADDAIILDSSFVFDESIAVKPSNFTQYGAVPENLAVSTLSTSGDVTIAGNLTVNGTTTTVHAESIETEDDNITLRKNNPLGLAEGETAGLTIDNYDGSGNAAHIVTDKDGTLFCGDAESLQPLLTRLPEGQMTDGNWLRWDAQRKCATTASKEVDMTYSAYQRLQPSEIDLTATYFLYEEAQLTIVNADGAGNVTTSTYSSGVSVTLPTPENPDYDFLGYYNNADFSGNPVTKVVMLDDTTVYCKWDTVKTFAVQIKSSITGAVLISERIEKGQTFTLPAHPVVGNYTFDNYTAGGAVLAEGAVITITADVVILANYTAMPEIDLGIQDSSKKYLFAPSVISNFYRWGESEPAADYSAEGYDVTSYSEPSAMPAGFSTLSSYVAGLLIATKNDSENYAWAVASGILTITNKNTQNYLTLPLSGYKIGTDTAAAGSRGCFNLNESSVTVLNINAQLAAEIVTAEPGYYGRNVIAYKEQSL